MPTHHVIIGGGPVATNAIETIREFDNGDSRITLICDEPAHSRMVLPYWLAGKVPRGQVMTADEASYQKLGVEPLIGVRALKVEPDKKTLLLSEGSTLQFDDLLIATGASPLGLSIPGADLPGVGPLWTLDHTQSVLDLTNGLKQPRVVLVGAGFIGLIVLNAMFQRDWQLAVVELQAHVLPRMLDIEGARLVESWLAEKGIEVHTGTSVQAIHESDSGKSIELANGSTLSADLVILATGIHPNTGFIADSVIETDEGILVDDRMQTNIAHVYAGGDVAQGPVLFSDQPAIHAIQTTAVDHGRVAGANMAGQEVHYPGSLSMNVLDVCGLQCASFGNWSDRNAESMIVSNPSGFIHRRLLWTGEELTGAIFVGRANDMGMLNDVGMVKGILQTRTSLGPWKDYLRKNPFDIRRAYIAAGVAKKLVGTTLLGRPAQNRHFRFGSVQPQSVTTSAHNVFVGTKEQ